MNSGRVRRRPWGTWVLAASGSPMLWIATVLTALVVEAILMRTVAAQMIAPYVPLWADQIQYLTEAYRGYDFIREHGLLTGTIEAVRQPRPQGWLLQTIASLYMLIVGPSRLAALDMNLALLLLWLGVTGYAIKRAFGVSVSLVTLGLLLSTSTLLHDPGGLFDFRLDFAATCLWGTLLVLMAVSNGREGWGTRAAILALGVVMIVTRFISSFYLLPFGGLVILFSIVTRWKAGLPWQRWLSWMVPVVAIWAVVFGVILASSYESFASYYIRGHVTGEERAIRRIEAGLVSVRDDLLFYPRTLRQDHLGRSFQYLAEVTVILSLASGLLLYYPLSRPAPGWRARIWYTQFSLAQLWSSIRPSIWPWQPSARSERQDEPPLQRPLPWFLGVAALGLVATYGILTIVQVKTTAVAGPVVAPIVLLVVGIALWAGRVSWDDPSNQTRPIFRILGPAIIIIALAGQWYRAVTDLPGLPARSIVQTFGQIIDDATPYLAEAKGRPVTWSIDGHYAEISYSTVQVVIYERTGGWINLPGGLGYGPLEQALDSAELLEAASGSDVLILSKYPPGTRSPFPYDQSILDQHHVLERYAEENLTLLGSYKLPGVSFFLYARPRSSGTIDNALAEHVGPERVQDISR
jgi:hypothetical protein